MKILFLHGLGSTVGGVKPTFLAQHGHEVFNPKLPDDNFDEAVQVGQEEFDGHHPDVVVGSSRGGAVAMNIDSGSTPLVLLCPAWKRFGTATTVNPGTVILHSKADDMVPFTDSVELVKNSGLSWDSLIVVGSDHRLGDDKSLKTMIEAVERVIREKNLTKIPKIRIGWRRLFGILAIIMTLQAVSFAVLFDVSKASWKPLLIVTGVLFLIALGLGQKLLYQGKQRSKASAVMGASFFTSLYVFYSVVSVFLQVVLGIHRPAFAFPAAPFDPIEALFFGSSGNFGDR